MPSWGPGDGDMTNVSNTAEDSSKLGGPPVDHLSVAEIIIIVITVVTFVIIFWLVFYIRLLDTRREIDERNQRKENGTTGGSREDSASHAASEEGEFIRLPSVAEESLELRHFPPVEPENVTAEGTIVLDLEQVPHKKKPLWHYIHWKDPYEAPIPRPVACGQSKGKHIRFLFQSISPWAAAASLWRVDREDAL